MNKLILLVCAFTNPDCFNNPERIVVEYYDNVNCDKVAQQSAAAILGPTDRLLSYSCDGGWVRPPLNDHFVPVPDDGTIG
jgi:hypothetical protein